MPLTHCRGVVSPPSHAQLGCIRNLGALLGLGGKQGGGLQPFGVSFVLSLCSCAWICAWSQDIWVLSEQLTLASEASLCLSFPPAPRGGSSVGGFWGLRLSQGMEATLVLGKHGNNTAHSPCWEEACHHPALVLCPLAEPASTGGVFSSWDFPVLAVSALRC